MGEIAGFEYDIFISYTHRDNAGIGGDLRWIDEFHQSLENWLRKRRGFANIRIWRDIEIDGNTEFNAAVEHRLRNCALFFVMHSRNYFHSAYCRQELEWFHQYHGVPPGNLLMGEHHRVFNILLNNIPYPEWSEALKEGGETSGFSMHDARSDDDLGDFTSPHDPNFEKQLRKIVDAVEATVQAFLRVKTAETTAQPPAQTVRVFIAAADNHSAGKLFCHKNPAKIVKISSGYLNPTDHINLIFLIRWI